MKIQSLLLLSWSTVLFPTVDAQGGGGGDYQDMMNQNCPNFKCSSGFTPVPKSRIKFESTGCSSMGGGSMVFNGAGAGSDKPYESCCHQWHACYQVCGVSKKTCDATFDTCSKVACVGDEKCTKDLELNNMMMKFSGCKRFDEAQLRNCECTPNAKAPEKREAAIRKFYKKTAPESADKAASLAQKANTPSKLAGLFTKLLMKYPEAIMIKEDPMKAMFDKINLEDPKGEPNEAEDTSDEDKIEL